MKETNQKQQCKRKRIVYNYCSFEAFQKIFENRTLMFADITKSNDRDEIKYLWESYIEYARKRSPNSYASRSIGFLSDDLMQETEYLVACFSHRRDSLEMWSRYGNNGLCIGFDIDKLIEWAKHIGHGENCITYSKYPQNDYVICGDVKYMSQKQILSMISDECDDKDEITMSFSKFIALSTFIKRNSWKGEKEWRMCIPFHYDKELLEINSRNDSAQVCILDDKTIQRVEMSDKCSSIFKMRRGCFVPFESEMVYSVTLASNCKKSYSDVKSVALEYGFDHLKGKGRIKESKCSLR